VAKQTMLGVIYRRAARGQRTFSFRFQGTPEVLLYIVRVLSR
jgi:hypothetical protein